MLFWGCGLTFNATAQTLSAAEYRLVSKGEPAPYTGVILGLSTYRAETVKFNTQAKLIASQAATISEMAKDTTAYAARIRNCQEQLRAQSELTQSAQTALSTTSSSLEVTREAYQKVKQKWWERPIVWGPIGFTTGVGATLYAISKFNKK